jgi:hypothetical protein
MKTIFLPCVVYHKSIIFRMILNKGMVLTFIILKSSNFAFHIFIK